MSRLFRGSFIVSGSQLKPPKESVISLLESQFLQQGKTVKMRAALPKRALCVLSTFLSGPCIMTIRNVVRVELGDGDE